MTTEAINEGAKLIANSIELLDKIKFFENSFELKAHVCAAKDLLNEALDKLVNKI